MNTYVTVMKLIQIPASESSTRDELEKMKMLSLEQKLEPATKKKTDVPAKTKSLNKSYHPTGKII